MSPPGKTSLCAEIPCFPADDLWTLEEEKLVGLVSALFVKLGWIREEDILDSRVTKLRDAYPILGVDFERRSRKIMEHLKRFGNLRISGRNGGFLYAHFHEMMRFGKDAVEEYISSRNGE